MIASSLRVLRAAAVLVAACGVASVQAAGHEHKFDPSLQHQRAQGLPARVTLMVALDASGISDRALSTASRQSAVRSLGDRVLGALPTGGYTVQRRWENVPGMVLAIDATLLDALAARPEVVKLGTDMGAGQGNVEQSLTLTGFDQVASQFGYDGTGATIAVLDSGYDTNHPDLASSLIGQACFAEGGAACPGGAGSAEDDFGHGTWVSGVITGDGVVAGAGGAPQTGIYAVKVLDSNNSFTSTQFVVDGLNHIIGTGIDFDAVNMSLGTFATFPGDCDNAAAFVTIMTSAVNSLRAMGTLSIVSSGNQGVVDAMQAPSCIASAISVGATHDGGFQSNPICATTVVDTATCYSNASATLDIFAPGSEIRTSGLGGGVASVHGTSFAAPTVSACVALMRQANPALTPDEIEAALESSASVIVTAGANSAPRLDCFAAVNAVAAGELKTWHLDGVVFNDGGTASGSFVYDALRDAYVGYEITTYDNLGQPLNSYSDVWPASPGNDIFMLALPDASLADLTGAPVLAFNFGPALTVEGGTRDLALPGAGFDGEATCGDATCSFATFFRRAIRGRLVAADNFVGRVKYYLDGVTFEDGTEARGQFGFDIGPQTYFEPEVTTLPGAGPGAVYRQPWPVFAGFDRALRLVPDAALPDLTGEPLLFMDWLTPVNSGGTSATVDVNGFSEENTICAPDGNCWFGIAGRTMTAGRVVAPLLEVTKCNFGVGLAIPDGEPLGVSNDLTLPFEGPIVDLDIGLQVAHTWVGDLSVNLEHVDTGTTATLIDRPGVPALGQFGCSGDDIDLRLDDEGTGPADDACAATPPAIDGVLTPVSPLTAFDGESAGGTWRLSLNDSVTPDPGQLLEWCVYAKVVAGPDGRDLDGDGIVDAADNCVLTVNSDQLDADGDGVGNLCDADLNNDCLVNPIDLGVFRTAFFSTPGAPNWNPAADFNGDGVVNPIDLGVLRAGFFKDVGPSGVAGTCQ